MTMKFSKYKDVNNNFDLTDIEITVHSSDINLTELLECFHEFVLACGYFPKGELRYVEDEK